MYTLLPSQGYICWDVNKTHICLKCLSNSVYFCFNYNGLRIKPVKRETKAYQTKTTNSFSQHMINNAQRLNSKPRFRVLYE